MKFCEIRYLLKLTEISTNRLRVSVETLAEMDMTNSLKESQTKFPLLFFVDQFRGLRNILPRKIVFFRRN